MRSVVWIVILFAVAVGLALASGVYTGNLYVVAGQTMLRMNLHAFVLGLIIAVVILYFLVRLIAGLLNIPGRMQRFGTPVKAVRLPPRLIMRDRLSLKANSSRRKTRRLKFWQTKKQAATVRWR